MRRILKLFILTYENVFIYTPTPSQSHLPGPVNVVFGEKHIFILVGFNINSSILPRWLFLGEGDRGGRKKERKFQIARPQFNNYLV